MLRFFTYEEIKNKHPGNNWKPAGLWLSIDESWIDWCEEEGFSTCNLNTCFRYEAKLNKDKLYIVDTFDKLNELRENYNIEKNDIYNWELLVSNYHGIVFDNYKSIKAEVKEKK